MIVFGVWLAAQVVCPCVFCSWDVSLLHLAVPGRQLDELWDDVTVHLCELAPFVPSTHSTAGVGLYVECAIGWYVILKVVDGQC